LPIRSRHLTLPLLSLGLLAWTGCQDHVATSIAGLPTLSLPQVSESAAPPSADPSPEASATPAPSAVPTASTSPAATPGAVASPSPIASPTSGPADKPLTQLGRGMNLGNALEAPKEGDWGITLKDTDFRAIRDAGFKTVRVPVRFNAHVGAAYPYPLDKTFLARVDWVVAVAKAYDLTVVLDWHQYDEFSANPAAEGPKFLSIWQLAAHYASENEGLAFELLNEPHGAMNAATWNTWLAATIQAVRAIDKTRTLVVGGVNDNTAAALAQLNLPASDEYLVGTFHFYGPMLFTHQGATTFAGPDYSTTGVTWPGPPAAPIAPTGTASLQAWVRNWFQDYDTLPAEANPAGPDALHQDFDTAQAWADQTEHPVWLGEFGVHTAADTASRAAWTRAVRTEAEAHGMPWAYWEFGSGFGVYDRNAGAWNEPLRQALME
jgi:endoglucanase